mmetsp:Transcript_103582/g.189616  ORF Transcript_103582/g.189616 Transcript_103582/m.189616 type:complete len:367 (+) Transcript_103582:30-1130(+)
MAQFHLLAAIASAYIGRGISWIPPDYAQNLTVYHVNPIHAGATPVDMDTGDALGDLTFYLNDLLLPLECNNATTDWRQTFDCDNPERVDHNLVVTKVDLSIDSRFTTYSACNYCTGSDPFTGQPCVPGSYSCSCMTSAMKLPPCDRTRVGMEGIDVLLFKDVSPKCAAALQSQCGSVKNSSTMCGLCTKQHKSELYDSECRLLDFKDFCPGPHIHHCNDTAPEWTCWAENIPRKTLGGRWFSTLKQGLCDKSNPTGNCSWKVWSTKTVKNACLKDKFVRRVESASPGCFNSCGSRNTTSSCWISCFFDTLFGPVARRSTKTPLGGLPIAEIEKAWTDAFLPEEEGGCPLVEIPEFWTPPPEATVVV